MTRSPRHFLPRAGIYALVTASGLAALSWEVLWQIKASLALGVSAWGTALTLAITMGGMGAGSLSAGRFLRQGAVVRPARLYAALELTIGLAGLLLGTAFQLAESLDTFVYAGSPGVAPLVYLLGITVALGLPAFCMGATLPVLGLLAAQSGTSIAVLYGLNTLGAACGVLLAAFALIPSIGVLHSCWLIAAVNLTVSLCACLLSPPEKTKTHAPRPPRKTPALSLSSRQAQVIVCATGFATFVLEVSWFRSLTAAFSSTTGSFAIMLFSVLVSLGLASGLVGLFRQLKLPLGALTAAAGALILLASPVIERFDLFSFLHEGDPASVFLNRFMLTLFVIGPPVTLLGVALPWLLDERETPRDWGRLYALNTLSAIAGSLGAAWLLLPSVGFARTAWLAGALVAASGVWASPRRLRPILAIAGVCALVIAITFESGVGRTRTQGYHFTFDKPDKIVAFLEGPEATVSAVEYGNGKRSLVIDGFVAASQFDYHGRANDHYMAWMGHLPMLLHHDPKAALVICFGTGQTTNAVRRENPKSVDVVDINPRVLKLAPNFDANQGVLTDKRVTATVMDGRAYMRRTRKMYDVITLEPMPPNFAGVNALYSREFYALAAQRLSPTGVIAQWVPFQFVGPHYMASIVRTFTDVFPDAILWMDPISKTGILLGTNDRKAVPGTKEKNAVFGTVWPGFARNHIKRAYDDDTVRKSVLLDQQGVAFYAANGEVITDDNQLLAYQASIHALTRGLRDETNRELDDAAARQKQAEEKRTPAVPASKIPAGRP